MTPEHPGRLRLVCLPPAGGSAATYRPWRTGLPSRYLVRPLELAGRGARRTEPPTPSLRAAAAELLPAAAGPEPYALVGHSLGGLVAVELARLIAATPDLPRPAFVLVAGSRPPHHSTARVFAPLLDLDDGDLLAALAEVGAVNPALITSPLRGLFLPALRADLRLIVEHRVDPGAAPLPVDLVAWHAAGDPLAPPEMGWEWERYTSGRFAHRSFAGGHFFLYDDLPSVVAALGEVASVGVL